MHKPIVLGFVLVALACCSALAARLQPADTALPTPAEAGTIAGEVRDALGRPIENAVVVIHAARARVGVRLMCPTCYPDCGRYTLTDAAGRFEFSDVDPTLYFSLIASKPGYSALHTQAEHPSKDPGAGILTLRTRDDTGGGPPISGVVVNEQGAPVERALVRLSSVSLGNGITYLALPAGFEQVAVTDADGAFWLGTPSPVQAASLWVEAPGLAPKYTPYRPRPKGDTDTTNAAEQQHRITLDVGVTITGRVIHDDGTPFAGRQIILNPNNVRTTGEFFKPLGVGTDTDGSFVLSNAPAAGLALVVPQREAGDDAVVAPVPIELPEAGGVVRMDDIVLPRGAALAGVLVLPDGSPIKNETLTFEQVVNNQPARATVTTDADGAFSLRGLVPGTRAKVIINSTRYRFVATPGPREPQEELWGIVTADHPRLTLVAEPWTQEDRMRPFTAIERPMRGLDSVPAGASPAELAEADSQSGNPRPDSRAITLASPNGEPLHITRALAWTPGLPSHLEPITPDAEGVYHMPDLDPHHGVGAWVELVDGRTVFIPASEVAPTPFNTESFINGRSLVARGDTLAPLGAMWERQRGPDAPQAVLEPDRFRGRVVDAAGDPVPGVMIAGWLAPNFGRVSAGMVMSASMVPAFRTGESAAVTDAQGRFTLDQSSLAENLFVMISGDGIGFTHTALVPDRDNTVTVAPPADLRVQVRTPAGEPAAGLSLEIKRDVAMSFEDASSQFRIVASTDDDGVLVVRNLAPDARYIASTLGSTGQAVYLNAEPLPTPAEPPATLVGTPGVTLSGRVYASAPERQRLRLWLTNPQDPTQRVGLPASDTGEFSIEGLRQGAWKIEMMPYQTPTFDPATPSYAKDHRGQVFLAGTITQDTHLIIHIRAERRRTQEEHEAWLQQPLTGYEGPLPVPAEKLPPR